MTLVETKTGFTLGKGAQLVNLSFSHWSPAGGTLFTVTVSLFKSDGVTVLATNSMDYFINPCCQHFPQSMDFIAPAANFPTTITGAIAKVTITTSTANGLLFDYNDHLKMTIVSLI
jgi:hypothetical protein